MIRFTKHAREAIDEREIALEWIDATVAAPDFVEPAPGIRSVPVPTKPSPAVVAGCFASCTGRKMPIS
jgi:hypothetical protein